VVAFTTSCVVLVLLTAIGLSFMGRRPVGTPLTWGEAMVAAVFVFFVMFWAYGVVPHFWLAWADGDLHMTPNRYFAIPRTKPTDATLKWPLPITVALLLSQMQQLTNVNCKSLLPAITYSPFKDSRITMKF